MEPVERTVPRSSVTFHHTLRSARSPSVRLSPESSHPSTICPINQSPEPIITIKHAYRLLQYLNSRIHLLLRSFHSRYFPHLLSQVDILSSQTVELAFQFTSFCYFYRLVLLGPGE